MTSIDQELIRCADVRDASTIDGHHLARSRRAGQRRGVRYPDDALNADSARRICIALEDVDRVVLKASELPTPRYESLVKSYKEYKRADYERQLIPAYAHARAYLDQAKPVAVAAAAPPSAPRPSSSSSSPAKSRPPSPAKAAPPKPKPKPEPKPTPPPSREPSLAEWFVAEIDIDSAELVATLVAAGLRSPAQLLRLTPAELDTLIAALTGDGKLTLLQQIWLRGRVRPRLKG